MKILKKFSLFIVFFILCERFCTSQTDGFRVSKIIAFPSQDKTPLETLSQPFYFLGSGKQFYAFESKDHQVVLKFVKQSRRKPLPWLANLPLPAPLNTFRDRYLQKREKRLSELLESCQLASRDLARETGIIDTHLTPVQQQTHIVTLFDKLGVAHRVDLEQTQFVMQKKATLLTTFSHESIDEMLELTVSLSHKGVVNLDPMIKRNFGQSHGKMILLDFGSLKKDKKVTSFPYLQRSLFLQLLSLREHLQNNQPQDVAYFDEQMQKTL